MPEILCTAKRIGDYDSRTEEYELAVQIKYLASRAYEINAALDACVETARAAIAESDPDLANKPTEESLFQLSWKTLQSAKYEEGAPKTRILEL